MTPEEKTKKIEGNNQAVVKVHTVVIQQMKFSPEDLVVNEGDTVMWINRDIVEHNVTEEMTNEWTSGSLPAGKSWSKAVVKDASYLCTLHPVMKGSLKVR